MADELAYVASTSGVMVIDTVTQAQIDTWQPGVTYNYICITKDGATLYATRSLAGLVDVINAATGALITSLAAGANPVGICITPDSARVYVASNTGTANAIYTITTATNAISGPFLVQPSTTYGGIGFPSVSPDGTKLSLPYFGATTPNGHAEVYSVPALTLLGTIPVTPAFTGTDSSTDWLGNTKGYNYYAGHNVGLAFDMAGFTTVATFTTTTTSGVGQNLTSVTPDGLHVYACCFDTLSKWSTLSNTEVTSFLLGTNIGNGRITPDGKTLVISDNNASFVYLWDLPTDTVRFSVPTSAHGQGLCLFAPTVAPPAVKIGQLFIPRKGFGSSGTGYQASDFDDNWLAIENWANHDWTSATPIPQLFIPNKPIGRAPTSAEIDQNWRTIERWANSIGTIV